MPSPSTRFILALATGALSTTGSAAGPTTSYPMAATAWEGPKVTFSASEVFPEGLMTVAEGYAVLKDGSFADGTIEFDMKPLDYADTGVLFHRRDADTAEFVYVRADPDCPAANDCVQYAPVTNGRMQWNTYSNYQSSAPISDKGWNHLRLVVAGGRMRLFVNHATSPSLDVPRLQGTADQGGLAVKGPAIFANLIVRPGDTGGPTSPAPSNAALPGIARQFDFAVTAAPADRPPTAADMPRTGWKAMSSEPDGLVNLARAVPRNTTAGLEMAWLKLTIDAKAAGDKMVDLGFVPRAWLFLNGSPVYAGDNFYYPQEKRLAPAGRFAPDNAKVTLHLHAGRNELVLALDDAWRRPNGQLVPDHYGWATMVRFEDPNGLAIGR